MFRFFCLDSGINTCYSCLCWILLYAFNNVRFRIFWSIFHFARANLPFWLTTLATRPKCHGMILWTPYRILKSGRYLYKITCSNWIYFLIFFTCSIMTISHLQVIEAKVHQLDSWTYIPIIEGNYGNQYSTFLEAYLSMCKLFYPKKMRTLWK